MLNPVHINLSKETLDKLKSQKYRDFEGNILNIGDCVAHISALRGRSADGETGKGVIEKFIETNKIKPVYVRFFDGTSMTYSPSTLKILKKAIK